MKTIILLLALLALPTRAAALDWKWDRVDVGMEVGWQALHLVDWGQTRDIAARHQYYEKESAWAVGRHPSTNSVNQYMLASAVVHLTVSAALPSSWRKVWNVITILDTGKCVVGNYQIGLQVRF